MSTDAPIQVGTAEAEDKSAAVTSPTLSATASEPMDATGTVEALVQITRDALLDQHLNPALTAEGEKIPRFDLGRREGKIEAHLETLATLHPAYDVHTPASLRIVLLGEALTTHASKG